MYFFTLYFLNVLVCDTAFDAQLKHTMHRAESEGRTEIVQMYLYMYMYVYIKD